MPHNFKKGDKVKIVNSTKYNGVIGILRKVIGDDFIGNLVNRGDVFSPVQL